MKAITKLGLAMMMVFFFSQISFAQKGGNDIKELVFTSAHTCDNSKTTIETALRATEGVSFAEMNQEAKTVTVKYDSKVTDAAKIQASAEKTGFKLNLSDTNADSDCGSKKKVEKKKTKKDYSSC